MNTKRMLGTALLFCALQAESQQVYCFEDVDSWRSLVGPLDVIETDRTSVSEAIEVSEQLADNALLGKVLTFQAADTGMLRDISLEVLEASLDVAAGFTFNDVEPSSGTNVVANFEDALSVGDIDNFENDDWSATAIAGPGFSAFAFELRNNNVTAPEEALRIYDNNDQMIGQCDPVPTSVESSFFGFVSTLEARAIEFDEGNGDDAGGGNDDDIAIAQLQFGDVIPDGDMDGIPFNLDNCMLVNNPDQRDSNGDGFGNECDADLNNDCIVNTIDLGLFRSVFFTADADADFNGDGIVNVIDLGRLRTLFFQVPGPSGIQFPCI